MVLNGGGGGAAARLRAAGDCGRVHAAALESLAATAVLRLLTAAARRRSWQHNKGDLTYIVHTHVPHNLRQRLQERVLHDWRVYDTVSLRLLELLFSSTTSSLRLIHVRTFYRNDFLTLLPRLTGLHELSIQDPAWTLCRRQLSVTAKALSTMRQLRVVTLQYCGHNLLLATLATHCPALQVLDVRGSRGVDDEGVWRLVTLCHHHHASSTTAPHHASHAQKVNLSLRSCWVSAFKSLTCKMITLRKPVAKVYPADDACVTWAPCCSTLTFVDLRCTQVSGVGVAILTHALPTHARLAHDAHATHASVAQDTHAYQWHHVLPV